MKFKQMELHRLYFTSCQPSDMFEHNNVLTLCSRNKVNKRESVF